MSCICTNIIILDMKLSKVGLPHEVLICHNKKCNNIAHTECIDMLCSDIIHACLHAGEESIPQTGARGRQAVPYWEEQVEPFKDRSLFWPYYGVRMVQQTMV